VDADSHTHRLVELFGEFEARTPVPSFETSAFLSRFSCQVGSVHTVQIDDIISYHDLVTEEKAALQKGMNFGVGKKYSVFLMSPRQRR